MTTNFKTDVRTRMRATGEKYTEARRALLAARESSASSCSGAVERVTVHTNRNGLPLTEADCEATTKAGRQCRNPFVHGQFWPGGHPEVLLMDGPDTRMLAQRRCHVHVDHTRPVEIVLLMDDVDPTPLSGTFVRQPPVWQDPQSLALIRDATLGRARADTFALYLALTESDSPDALADVGVRCGLSGREAEAALNVLTNLGLVSDGALVG